MRLFITAAFGITLPSLYMSWTHTSKGAVADSLIFGLGILGAAFILSWAAEVAQIEISRGLAIAILALVAILPEYAVDLYFAWMAAHQAEYSAYAMANMTGANRLLVGVGWPFIVFLFCVKFGKKQLHLDHSNRAEISYLTLATLYAFTIPLKGNLSLIDCALLVSLFSCYAWRTAVMEVHEPHLIGPARLIGELTKTKRRLVNVFLFLFAGITILSAAARFAEALIASGEVLGIDEYLLVQWVAPLASEAPEFIIAAIWTLRGEGISAIGALISSLVNQWTLLVGTIPLVYSISLGEIGQMSLDSRQDQEIFLTAAQSLFAITVLMNLRISVWEAFALLAPFTAQLIYPEIRIEVTIIYLVLTFLLLFRRGSDLRPLFREGLIPGQTPGQEQKVPS